MPEARFVGLGGAEMEKAGVELVVHQREIAVSGLVELLRDLHRIVRAWLRMTAALRALRPDLVVLVDSSDFNIPFARRARRLGCPTLYYVSPQVWAWRTGRIRKLARWVNQLAVIFPFEPKVYAGTRVPVSSSATRSSSGSRSVSAAVEREGARRALGLPANARIVALLPGSRAQRDAPPAAAPARGGARAARARSAHPLRAAARRVDRARDARGGIRAAQLPSLLQIDVLEGHSHAACAPPTSRSRSPAPSTLEAALLDCPFVVAARTNRLTAWLLRRLVRVDTLTMPNLIAGEPIVPEFLQEQARPERSPRRCSRCSSRPARDAQRAKLAVVRQALAKGGAARRAAEIAAEMLRGRLPA